jgi:hypothetical protein
MNLPPLYDPEGRLNAEALAVLFSAFPTDILKQDLTSEELWIKEVADLGALEEVPEIPNCERIVSAIKSELARRGALE